MLSTKLFIPPLGKHLVERPRLVDLLNECLRPGCRLALVSAPAGFGKTTLVSAWVASAKSSDSRLSAAWVSLDERDQDPIQFWTYVCAALQGQNKQVGAGAQAVLSSMKTPELEPVITVLLNDLAQTTAPLLLVLDDFHLIDTRAIIGSLQSFLERIPSNVHLLILTRVDPPLPLALLRGRGQLVEIRLADLRFSVDEADSFLNMGMGLNLTPNSIAALNNKTEGWAAGLQMAAVSMLGRANVDEFIATFSGSHRYILDYLVEEVLKRQTAGIQEFLLKTSILDTLCGPLCDALLKDAALDSFAGSRQVLEYLEGSNLFIIPLDDERRWYRYHQLFADLLRKRLGQAYPERIKELHLRASQWYAQNELPYQAVEHAFLGEDFELVAQLLEDKAESILGRGEQAWFLKWVNQVPMKHIRAHLRLGIINVSLLAMAGSAIQAEQCLLQLEGLLPEVEMPASSREWAEGRIAAVHTLIASYQEDMDGALHYCQLALQKISGTQRNDFHWRGTLLVLLSSLNLWKGDLEAARQNLLDAIQAETQAQDAYGFLDATTHLAQVLWMQGRLQEAVKFCEEGLQYIEQHGLGCTPAAGLLFLGWGFILCERYELDEAEKYIRRGLELNRGTSNALTMIWADQIWMRLLASRNDLLAADAVAQDASQLEKEAKIPWWFEKDFSAVKVWVWIRQGRLDEAEQYLRQQGITTDGKIQHPNQGEYHALIYLLLVRGDLAAAKTQGERFLAWAQAERQFGWVIACRVLLALIFREGGNRQQALQSLAYALELAETEDYAQVFLDKGDTIVDLLYEAVQKGIHPEYASRLMALYHRDHPEPAAGKYNRPRQPGLVAPVSEREIEVLRLLVEGLTNKEIALKLCISVRTVKYHTTSIFTKLNVNNRTQAVSKVKELGIC